MFTDGVSYVSGIIQSRGQKVQIADIVKHDIEMYLFDFFIYTMALEVSTNLSGYWYQSLSSS